MTASTVQQRLILPATLLNMAFGFATVVFNDQYFILPSAYDAESLTQILPAGHTQTPFV